MKTNTILKVITIMLFITAIIACIALFNSGSSYAMGNNRIQKDYSYNVESFMYTNNHYEILLGKDKSLEGWVIESRIPMPKSTIFESFLNKLKSRQTVITYDNMGTEDIYDDVLIEWEIR